MSADTAFPPPESAGGWPTLSDPEAIEGRARMAPERLRTVEASQHNLFENGET